MGLLLQLQSGKRARASQRANAIQQTATTFRKGQQFCRTSSHVARARSFLCNEKNITLKLKSIWTIILTRLKQYSFARRNSLMVTHARRPRKIHVGSNFGKIEFFRKIEQIAKVMIIFRIFQKL